MTVGRYRVVVEGELDEVTAVAFEDMEVERARGRTTLHTGPLDQSGLNGVLDRLRAMGVELVALDRVGRDEIPPAG